MSRYVIYSLEIPHFHFTVGKKTQDFVLTNHDHPVGFCWNSCQNRLKPVIRQRRGKEWNGPQQLWTCRCHDRASTFSEDVKFEFCKHIFLSHANCSACLGAKVFYYLVNFLVMCQFNGIQDWPLFLMALLHWCSRVITPVWLHGIIFIAYVFTFIISCLLDITWCMMPVLLLD